jgi:hypothetical protein
LEFGVTLDEVTGGKKGAPILARGAVAFPDVGADPQGAGFHPVVEHVQVSVDDPTFARPVYARVDAVTGTWTAQLTDAGRNSVVYVRALRDRTASPVVEGRVRGR